MQTRVVPILAIVLAVFLGACSKSREITNLDRAEADARAAKARAEIQFNDIGKAETLLVEALGFNPDAYDYWADLANVRLRLGKNKEARKACQQAVEACQRLIKQNPEDIDIRIDQIRLLVSLGDNKAARETLEQAGRDLPKNQVIRACIDNKLVDQLAADPGLLKLPE
ncbi:tetratricopeptide repeat protein [Termitidicoccus mucosus]